MSKNKLTGICSIHSNNLEYLNKFTVEYIFSNYTLIFKFVRMRAEILLPKGPGVLRLSRCSNSLKN